MSNYACSSSAGGIRRTPHAVVHLVDDRIRPHQRSVSQSLDPPDGWSAGTRFSGVIGVRSLIWEIDLRVA